MYLFFDTETTGLARNWKAPVTDVANWPRIVQLAWVECDDAGAVIGQAEWIIRPDGFTIPLEASRIHGITMEIAFGTGVPIRAGSCCICRSCGCTYHRRGPQSEI